MNRTLCVTAAAGAAVLATALLATPASATTRVVSVTAMQYTVHSGVSVTGTGFRPNSRVLLVECPAIDNLILGPRCVETNQVRVQVNGHGNFKAVIAAERCGGVKTPHGERCYVGVPDPHAIDSIYLSAAAKIFVHH